MYYYPSRTDFFLSSTCRVLFCEPSRESSDKRWWILEAIFFWSKLFWYSEGSLTFFNGVVFRTTVSARKTCSIPPCTQGANTFTRDWENMTRKLWGRDKPPHIEGECGNFLPRQVWVILMHTALRMKSFQAFTAEQSHLGHTHQLVCCVSWVPFWDGQ